MKMSVLILALAGVLLPGLAAPQTKQKIWDESEIIAALSIYEKPGSRSRFFHAGKSVECNVAAIMKSAGAVRMYESAGDVVASNPSKTAGVKIVGKESRKCKESAEQMLLLLE